MDAKRKLIGREFQKDQTRIINKGSVLEENYS
jgi:hypothetical protein